MEERLTKKEKKELKKQEWQEQLEKEQRKKNLQKIGFWLGIIVLIIGGIWILTASTGNSSSSSSATAPAISGKDITYGNKHAKVTLIEYGDFQCPACGAYHPMVKQLLQAYKDKIYFAFRNFPLTSIHQNAMVGAQAAYAAYVQGKFWPMHDMLYENQSQWSDLSDPTSIFNQYAQKIGLNIDTFKKDYASQSTKNFINAQEDQGISIGVNATPTFFVNNKEIQNPTSYDAFKQLIDQKLAGK